MDHQELLVRVVLNDHDELVARVPQGHSGTFTYEEVARTRATRCPVCDTAVSLFFVEVNHHGTGADTKLYRLSQAQCDDQCDAGSVRTYLNLLVPRGVDELERLANERTGTDGE